MCWSIIFLEDLIIRIIVLCAIVAIIKILIPWVLSLLGAVSAPIVQIIYVVLWAIVAIWCVVIVFDLLQCASGFSLIPRRVG